MSFQSADNTDRGAEGRTTDDAASGKTWYEEFTVSGGQALDKVKELIAEGNVRRLFIKNSDGRVLLEVPLTAGVAVTAVTAVIAPALVAVGAVAAFLAQVTIGVERVRPQLEGTPESGGDGPQDG
ncbi:DUF4342 domain-containing protein [Ornithinicoccus hortensis]|uniref:Uncharacterized protein DUF4342 n=1 Tax=Ornithinicoccus hortensis TaxID=82346 RepID=A0A542YNI2_9MICO|nr:DUF4342 domain-containing protein [Ornithinicoccus hortensis]TQL49663.1 uncharacterized protein DUF4342 [Ornithinicoccus hortensis]